MGEKRQTLKIVWFFMSHYKIPFLFLILLAVTIGILETLNLAILYPILSVGLEAEATPNPFLSVIYAVGNFLPLADPLVRYCILFIFLAFFVFISKILYFYFSTKLTAMIVINAKKKVFEKCINSDYQFFIDNKQGEILFKTSQAPNSIADLLRILSNVVVELVLSISVFVLLLSMSWKGTIIIIFGGVGYYYLTKYLSIRIHYFGGKKQLESGQIETVVINEFTSGVKQIRVFETFDYWQNLFDSALHTFWKYVRKGTFWSRVPELALILLLYLSIGSVVIFIRITNPASFAATIPLIGTFAFAIFMVIPKISKFGNYRMNFMQMLPKVEAVYALINDNTYTQIKNGEEKFSGLQSGISFKDVNFAHRDRDDLLKDFTFNICKDKTTAMVGPSGSGKSTVVNLLLRLHDVDSGGVYIDDSNIKDLDIFSFLRKIGFVSQDTFIYNASIRDNIAFGGNYTDEEVFEAARFANADEFIKQLPEGYNTIVGDRGMRISGGEKQRIAIARAMIRKPEILILDEATSSLDNISEKIVQDAINKVSKNCTTLMIAHRLTTIQNADVIHVLDHGKIVESGTHKELLNKKGSYWDLYNIQKEEQLE